MPGTKELLAAGIAASVVAGGAYALTMAVAPGRTAEVTASGASSAAAARTWKIKHLANRKNSRYGSVLALGSRDVWVGGGTGSSCCGEAGAAHWNGRTWSALKLPSGFEQSKSGSGGNLRSLSGSAANNVWAVADKAANNYTYTLRWNGHRWSVQHDWKHNRPGALTVLGPRDVWAIDGLGSTRGVRHFDGKSWKLIKAPMTFNELSALSAKDIWAAVTTTAQNGGDRPGVAHWDGKKWSLVSIPEISSASDSVTPELSAISATSAEDVWVTGHTGAADSTFLPVALHWDGKTWQRRDPAGLKLQALETVVTDGAGGAWAGEGLENGEGGLVRFSGGKWTKVKLPGRKGAISEVSDLARIPGSTSVWAAGGLTGPFPKAGPPPQQAEVLAY